MTSRGRLGRTCRAARCLRVPRRGTAGRDKGVARWIGRRHSVLVLGPSGKSGVGAWPFLPNIPGCADGIHPSRLGKPAPVRPGSSIAICATRHSWVAGKEGRQRAELPEKHRVRDRAELQTAGVGGVKMKAYAHLHLLAGMAGRRLREVR